MASPITKAPEPIRIAADHYRIPSYTLTLHAYDLWRNEHGSWECNCQGYTRWKHCKHEQHLVEHLTGKRKSVVADKGITLEDLFRDMI